MYKLRYTIPHNVEHYGIEILKQRGVDEYERLISPSKKDWYAPELLKNIHDGYKRLMKHIEERSKIFLVIDSDQDGVASASIFYLYMKKAFPECQIKWFTDEGKFHGVKIEDIPLETKLIILPDAGSNQKEEHEQLQEMGIDILILDHHNIEPNHQGKDICLINCQDGQYPNPHLTGAAVVYKFCCYIDYQQKTSFAKEYIDLVALGLIGDMATALSAENQFIIQYGLRHIKNSFFKELLNLNSFFSSLETPTPMDIAFNVVPYINACARLGTKQEKEMMFEGFINGDVLIPSTKRGCKDKEETKAIQAARLCSNIKNRQKREKGNHLELLEAKIEEKNLLQNEILAVIVDDENMPRSLMGLTAMELAAKYQKPTIVLKEEDDQYVGSIRNIGGTELVDFQSYLQGLELGIQVLGHPSAAGIQIPKENFILFINKTNIELSSINTGEVVTLIDYLFVSDERPAKGILQIAELNYIWGKDLEEPVVAFENIPFYEIEIYSMNGNRGIYFSYNGVSFMKYGKATKTIEELPTVGTILGKCRNHNGYAQILITGVEEQIANF